MTEPRVADLPERWKADRAHTYSSENADLYRAYDNAMDNCADELNAALEREQGPWLEQAGILLNAYEVDGGEIEGGMDDFNRLRGWVASALARAANACLAGGKHEWGGNDTNWQDRMILATECRKCGLRSDLVEQPAEKGGAS